MKYSKQCPECGKEMTYKYAKSLKSSIRDNSKCQSCAQTGNKNGNGNKANTGKKFSEKHRRKLSEANGGDGSMHLPKLRQWYKDVKERDGHKCQLCRTTEGTMAAHHIFTREAFPEDELILDNGITLCISCHVGLHNRIRRKLGKR